MGLSVTFLTNGFETRIHDFLTRNQSARSVKNAALSSEVYHFRTARTC